ncbi:MAG: glyoxylase I family protein [Pseudomonadales bacterium]|jgi:glyoxylase I family protein
MTKPRAIDHILLRTEQNIALINFYCAVLGCVVERPLADDIGLTQLRAGSSLIDIVDVNRKLGKAGALDTVGVISHSAIANRRRPK